MPKIKRSEFAIFLNTSGSQTPTWSRIGKGVTSQTVAYNPTTNTEQYVNEDSARTSVDAYAPSIATPMTCYTGEPVFEYVDGLRRSRAIGSAAETECLLVYIYDATTSQSTVSYRAEKCECSIAVNEFGGDATSPVAIDFDIALNGDPVAGSVTISDDGVPTFTAD